MTIIMPQRLAATPKPGSLLKGAGFVTPSPEIDRSEHVHLALVRRPLLLIQSILARTESCWRKHFCCARCVILTMAWQSP